MISTIFILKKHHLFKLIVKYHAFLKFFLTTLQYYFLETGGWESKIHSLTLVHYS